MIRILIIDDAETPEFLDGMCREIEGGYHTPVSIVHINPAKFLTGQGNEIEVAALLDEVSKRATEPWDVLMVDIRMREIERPEAELLEVSLSIAEAFRKQNRLSIAILYSGNLSKILGKVIEKDASSKKSSSEKLLKRVFLAGLAGFVERDQIVPEVYSLLEEPPWLLAVDRLLTRNANVTVSPQEAEFRGRTFGDLAAALRRQDPDGRKLAYLVGEYGVSCFADLNA